jgi:hypothetical protein
VLIWQLGDGTILAENGFTIGRAYTQHLRLKEQYFKEHPTPELMKMESYKKWYERIEGKLPHKDGPWLFTTAVLAPSMLFLFSFVSSGQQGVRGKYRYGPAPTQWVYTNKSPWFIPICKYFQKSLYRCILVRPLLWPLMNDKTRASTYDFMRDPYEIVTRNRDIIWNLYVHVILILGRMSQPDKDAAQGNPALLKLGRHVLALYLINRYRKFYKWLLDVTFTGSPAIPDTPTTPGHPERVAGTLPNYAWVMNPSDPDGIIATAKEAEYENFVAEPGNQWKPIPEEFYEAGFVPNLVTTLVRQCIGVRGIIQYDFTKGAGIEHTPPYVPKLQTVLKANGMVTGDELGLTGDDAGITYHQNDVVRSIHPAQLPLITGKKGTPAKALWHIEEDRSDIQNDIVLFELLQFLQSGTQTALEGAELVTYKYVPPSAVPLMKALPPKPKRNNELVWNVDEKPPPIVEPVGKNPTHLQALINAGARHPAAAANQKLSDIQYDFDFGAGTVPDWKADKEKYYDERTHRDYGLPFTLNPHLTKYYGALPQFQQFQHMGYEGDGTTNYDNLSPEEIETLRKGLPATRDMSRPVQVNRGAYSFRPQDRDVYDRNQELLQFANSRRPGGRGRAPVNPFDYPKSSATAAAAAAAPTGPLPAYLAAQNAAFPPAGGTRGPARSSAFAGPV